MLLMGNLRYDGVMAEFSLTLSEDQLQLQKWVHDFAENAIRPLALGRKNWLFAGSPRGGKACAMALRRSPGVNASFRGDTIHYHNRVDISVAVAIPDGLITPVVRDADPASSVIPPPY